MLVLSRKQGESIMIGENLMVVVLSVGAGRVKLGFVGEPKVQRVTNLDAVPAVLSAEVKRCLQ